jgi:5-methylthioadenosine/S-adenosylhomocysteine deaminase
MTIPVDTLISARYVIPVIPENTILENHSVAVKDGLILDLFPTAQLAQKGYQAANQYHLGEHILIPGLVNCHGHAAMSLLRGYADDLALMDWLNNHIWPAEAKWVSEEFVFDGSLIAIAEMIKTGTTTYSDMYFFPDQSGRAALHAGVRAQLSFPIFEFPSNWGSNAQDYIHKGLQVRDSFKTSAMVNVVFGPHAPYTVSDATFEKIAMLAEETDAAIQVHLHETQFEVDSSLQEHGLRPIARLNKLGILTPRTQCVHMTALNDDDIAMIKATGSHVIHCPESNMKLASGFCPVDKLLKAGINVALGTDSAASNDDLDLLGELKTAALLGKVVAGDPTALSGHSALRMATINGARALGMEDRIGSIERNKCADLCTVSIAEIDALPLYSPVSSLIYTNSGARVKYVWVDGKPLLDNGELTTLHEAELREKAARWNARIKT